MTLLTLIFKIALATATIVFVVHTWTSIKGDLASIASNHSAYTTQLQCVASNGNC